MTTVAGDYCDGVLRVPMNDVSVIRGAIRRLALSSPGCVPLRLCPILAARVRAVTGDLPFCVGCGVSAGVWPLSSVGPRPRPASFALGAGL